jgi:large subunit ribosomal protein L23
MIKKEEKGSASLSSPSISLGRLFAKVKYPLITEKTFLLEKKGFYTFIVDQKIHKDEIKILFENLFGIQIEKINTLMLRPKRKRVGKKIGYTSKYKKVIFNLKKNATFNYFQLKEKEENIEEKSLEITNGH